MKMLPISMERYNEDAMEVSKFLRGHDKALLNPFMFPEIIQH